MNPLQSLEALSPTERRTTITSFVFLLALMSAHSLMETARDALFLGALPAERLPYVYLIIVVVSALVSRRVTPLFERVRTELGLRAWLIVCSIVTAGFWVVVEHAGDAGYYALYVWSAVATTLALIQFWTFLGDLLSMSTAKRVYSFVAAGSAFGAIIGSGLAAVLTALVGARDILVVAAAAFALSAVAPWLLARWNADKLRPPDPGAPAIGLRELTRKTLAHPYHRAITALIVLTTMTVTLGDYLFKSAVAARVSPEHLGEFFGGAYFAFNALGLFVQLVLVSAVIRRFTITTSLAILPLFMLLGGTGFFVGGGIYAAALLRGADGSLRYSLHRTALELLYVPLSHAARSRLKLFNDLLAQRAAQGLASLAILGVVAIEASESSIAAALCIFATAWLALAVRLRRPYLDIFRRKLDPEMLAELEFPELDIRSLESLVAGLNDVDDRKVMAAMDILAREGRVNTIPALILYHPSENVVLRAIDLFAAGDRRDFIAVARRRLHDANPLLRASLLAATASVAAEEQDIRELLTDGDHAVRVIAAAVMLQRGWGVAEELRDQVRAELAHDHESCQLAFLRAMPRRGAGFEDELVTLLSSSSPRVRRRTIAEMVRIGDPRFLLPIRDALTDRTTRDAAQDALHDWGESSLAMLLDALDDRDLAPPLRWQLPYAIGQFPARMVVPHLAVNLRTEPDGMVRYRTIRELERIQQREGKLDIEAHLVDVASDLVSTALELLNWRVALEQNAQENPELMTSTHRLTEELIAGKETNTHNLIVHVIGLGSPGEDIGSIVRGLRSPDDALRSSSLELIEHLIPARYRASMVTLLSDQPPAARLLTLASIYPSRKLDYSELMKVLLQSDDFMLRSLAARRVGELRLLEHRSTLEDHLAGADSDYAPVLERALDSLGASAQS